MIVAGFALLAVGAADLVRQFAPRRWIGYLTVAVILLLLGSVSDALWPMIAGLAAGALWVWSMPSERRAPLGFWPAVLLGVLAVAAVVWLGPRDETGLIGDVWALRSPFGEIPFDLVVLSLGMGVFLLESANLVVRAALDGEHTWRPSEAPATTDAPTTTGDLVPEAATPVDPRSGFKGGRLIGPLERILVLILTLAAAYPLLAAMLAAKGIVRFPEISRDGETGARAEYFLVGSLVSWVIALGGAFVVWWAAHS
ncbi:hypothetical protein [Microbacterium sp. 179-I 3D3 NHS]|uniref:hypothetical protein n=1 Tax=Microbacterium sp. 179-I 3D3 NHS TaxID=3142382 RepID=UPI0039A005B6